MHSRQYHANDQKKRNWRKWFFKLSILFNVTTGYNGNDFANCNNEHFVIYKWDNVYM